MKKPFIKKKTPVSGAPTEKKTKAKVVSVAPGTFSHNALVFRAHVSEKAYRNQPKGQYVFWVAPKATKPEIRREISKRYGVTVISVNTVSSAGKPNHFRGKPGRSNATKKAIVTLREGQTIEIS